MEPQRSELRKDPILGRWTIIATERGERPSDFQTRPPTDEDPDSCPFCEGNEHRTPPEIIAVRPSGRPPNGPGWSIRVVPNKYPALRMEGCEGRRRNGLREVMPGFGTHEVVIESPLHELQLEQLSLGQIIRVVDVWLARARDLGSNSAIKYVLVFKNKGREAGASLEHAHTQIIATPILPATIRQELNQSGRYYEHRRRCIFCDLIADEQKARERIVASSDHFVALCPFAPRFAFETWILPIAHRSGFENLPEEERRPLAAMMRDVLLRLRSALDDPPYNFVIHTAPAQDVLLKHYHWHIEVLPRLATAAGFEWGTGFYINPVTPEAAARLLREMPQPVSEEKPTA